MQDQARTWHEGEVDELAVVSNALETLGEAIDRLQAFMPPIEGSPGEDLDMDDSGLVGPTSDDDPDPVRYTGRQGWDFSAWMVTKMSPMTTSFNGAKRWWQMLLQQGPTFYDEDLGKTFEVRPEVVRSLHTAGTYAARIAEMLMDGGVEGRRSLE